jgi:gluconolactonase
MDKRVLTLASGLGFTEGPAWTRDGRLFVVSVNRGKIYQVPTDGPGDAIEAAEPGGGPNGLAEGPDGSLWITQNAGQLLRASSPVQTEPSIQRWRRPDGPVEVVKTGVLCPSDCTFGPDGRLWFTDSNGPARDGSLGSIRALDISSGEMEQVFAEFPLGNGMGFGPGGERLFVCHNRVLQAFTLTAAGLRDDGIFFAPPGGADGCEVDSKGNVYVTGPAGQAVYMLDPSGKLVETIEIEDSYPTHVTFYGADLNLLAITSARGGKVYGIERDIPGFRPAMAANV